MNERLGLVSLQTIFVPELRGGDGFSMPVFFTQAQEPQPRPEPTEWR